MLKKILRYSSTGLLLIIIAILSVPSLRVSFQGWFQGLWMSDITFSIDKTSAIPDDVYSWNLINLNGENFQLSHFKDKPIVLSFWATWCPSCRSELAELKELNEKLGEDIHFISVSEETLETIEKSGLSSKYSFLYSTNYFPPFFSISVYPTLCIINQEGNLIFTQEGAGQLNTDKNINFLKGLIENK